MKRQLEAIFGELGIAQYLEAFLEQGFDSWETILDITESDLDALGVKLGHRRKLQRRIANSRGLGPDASLVSPTQPSVEESRAPEPPACTATAKFEARDEAPALSETPAPVVTKRKYRRHPKPDEHAPERPPSAYVLFSNKMREDLKGRNLSFTEIAKLVGENWQNLCQSEKEPFESQAHAAKDQYATDMAEYKKTAEYKKYTLYLQDFRLKHAHQSADASKRVKLSEPSSSGLASIAPKRSSRSGSGSESAQGGDHLPPSRQHRLGSAVSATSAMSTTDSQCSTAMTPHPGSLDDSSARSPTIHSFDRQSTEPSPVLSNITSPHDHSRRPPRRGSSWLEDQPQLAKPGLPTQQRSLPSLMDVFDLNGKGPLPPPSSESSNASPYSFPLRNRSIQSGSPGPPPGLMGGHSKPPSLRKEISTSSSSASSTSYPRTPVESSLPIHALLTGPKPGMLYDSIQPQNHLAPTFQASPGPMDHVAHQPPPPPPPPLQQQAHGLHHPHGMSGSGGMLLPNGYRHGRPADHDPAIYPCYNMSGAVGGPGHGGALYAAPSSASSAVTVQQNGKTGGDTSGLDGMSALLKAGEIVDRRAQ